MDGKLLPRIAHVTAEFALFVLGVLGSFMPTFLDKPPNLVNLVVGRIFGVVRVITEGLVQSSLLA